MEIDNAEFPPGAFRKTEALCLIEQNQKRSVLPPASTMK